MPKFIAVRTVGKLTEKQIAEGAKAAKKALTDLPDVKWIRSYYSVEEGKMYCEFEAPHADLVYEHALQAKMPIDSVRIVTELLPAMFR
jgi:hypothetical protein